MDEIKDLEKTPFEFRKLMDDADGMARYILSISNAEKDRLAGALAYASIPTQPKTA